MQSNAGWDDVVKVGSRAASTRTGTARTSSAINAAQRAGTIVGTEKKYSGPNSVAGTEGQRLTKIDRENEVAPPKTISMDLGKTISKARMDKGMKQSELAQKVNEKPNVINDYEAARAVPNQQLLGKLERALGVKLRGKDIGQPLGGPKKN
ncbi:multiprotein-bridging factor 1 [Saitoella coloradoensis]